MQNEYLGLPVLLQDPLAPDETDDNPDGSREKMGFCLRYSQSRKLRGLPIELPLGDECLRWTIVSYVAPERLLGDSNLWFWFRTSFRPDHLRAS